MQPVKTSGGARDPMIHFVQGLCLPLMWIDHLRNHWLTIFTFRPVGFFCAAALFVFLSGFATGKFYSTFLAGHNPREVYPRVWCRALQIYGLHLSVSAAVIVLAAQTTLGREIEIAVSRPWRALLDSALLMPSVPMLEFLPMYVAFLAVTPWLLRLFHSGQERPVLAVSFLLWLAAQLGLATPLPPYSTVYEGAGWQSLFVSALYIGFLQARQPLVKPAQTKALHLGLFGCMVALAMLRHWEVFGLEDFYRAIPPWWIDRARLGPLVLLNLYLWISFVWLVPEPLVRLVRQGRLFIALGHNAFAVFAWHILLFYVFMSWFPQLYRFSILGQALIVCFAVACLIFPVAFALSYFAPARVAMSHPNS